VEAVALAWVEGDKAPVVLETLGANLQSERVRTFGEAEDEQSHESSVFAVQVEAVAGWTRVVEPNGYLSSLPGNLVALSRGGRAVSVYWNVNAQMRFQYAVDGVLRRSFDPLLPDLGPEGDALPEEFGLRFGTEDADPRAESLLLAQRLTGVVTELSELLETPRSTWTAAGSG
jgi:hypothetical protein